MVISWERAHVNGLSYVFKIGVVHFARVFLFLKQLLLSKRTELYRCTKDNKLQDWAVASFKLQLWRFSIAAMRWSRSTQLLYIEPC